MRRIHEPDVLATIGPIRDHHETAGASPPSVHRQPGLVSDLAGYPPMRQLLEHFVCRLPDRLARLQRALAQRDGEAVRRLALQLKQSAIAHGYAPLALAAHRLLRRIDTMPMDRLRDAAEELGALALRVHAQPTRCVIEPSPRA